MSGCHSPYYRGYYGLYDDTKPTRDLVEDLLSEMERKMLEEMKAMEDRLKRHITENKREVIKEIKNVFNIPKSTQPKKESKNVK